MDVTAPVPPLEFDGFNDETQHLTDELLKKKKPVDELGGTWFAHPVIRKGVPIVGVILLLVAVWFLVRPADQKSQEVTITLQGAIPDAQVFLDDNPMGTLPVTFRFPADGDSHEVRVEAPRKVPWKRTFQPSTAKTQTILVEMSSLLADVKLVTSLQGAEIRVNREGKKPGPADEWIPLPLILEGLEPGLNLHIEARWRKKKWEMSILVPVATYVEMSVEPPSSK